MDPGVIHPGLCARCRHARRVHGKGGSVFWLCKAHRFDPAMPKYPALPVKHCRRFSDRAVGPAPENPAEHGE